MSDYPVSPGAPPYPILNEMILEAAQNGSQNPALDGQRMHDAQLTARANHDQLLVGLAERAEQSARQAAQGGAGAQAGADRAVGAAQARSHRAALMAGAQIGLDRARGAAQKQQGAVRQRWEQRFAEAEAARPSLLERTKSAFEDRGPLFPSSTIGGQSDREQAPGQSFLQSAEFLFGESAEATVMGWGMARLQEFGPGPKWPSRIVQDYLDSDEMWHLSVGSFALNNGMAEVLGEYNEKYASETAAMEAFVADWDIIKKPNLPELAELLTQYENAEPIIKSAFSGLALSGTL